VAKVLAFENVPSVSGHIDFRSSAGAPTPLATQTFTLGSQASIVIDTAAIPGLAGQAGSITISHNGPYLVCGPGISPWDRAAGKQLGQTAAPRFLESALAALEALGVPKGRVLRESYG
jgi:hypothetical protein